MYYSLHADNERNRLVESWKLIEQQEQESLYEATFESIFTEMKSANFLSEAEIRTSLRENSKMFYEGLFSDIISAAKSGIKAAGEDWKNSKEKKIAAGAMDEINKIFKKEKEDLDKSLPELKSIYTRRIEGLEKIKSAIEKQGVNTEMVDVIDKQISMANKMINTIDSQFDDVTNMADQGDEVADDLRAGKEPQAQEKTGGVTAQAASGSEDSSSPAEKVTQAADAFKQDRKQFEKSFFGWIKTNKDNLKDIIGSQEEEDAFDLSAKTESYLYEGVAEDLVKVYSNNEGFISGIEKVTGTKPSEQQIADLITNFVDSEDFKGQFGDSGQGLDLGDLEDEADSALKQQDITKIADVAGSEEASQAIDSALEDPEGKKNIEQTLKAAQEQLDAKQLAAKATQMVKNQTDDELEQQVKEMESRLPKTLWGKIKSVASGVGTKLQDKNVQKKVAKTAAILAAGYFGGTLGMMAIKLAMGSGVSPAAIAGGVSAALGSDDVDSGDETDDIDSGDETDDNDSGDETEDDSGGDDDFTNELAKTETGQYAERELEKNGINIDNMRERDKERLIRFANEGKTLQVTHFIRSLREREFTRNLMGTPR